MANNTLETRRITPAYAGNTSLHLFHTDIIRDYPRIRGEYSMVPMPGDCLMGLPPHTRGIQHLLLVFQVSHGITPAYAGNTSFVSLAQGAFGDYPRIRGEYFVYNPIVSYCGGLPPHTRGIHVNVVHVYEAEGITPAYAGNTFISNSAPYSSR